MNTNKVRSKQVPQAPPPEPKPAPKFERKVTAKTGDAPKAAGNASEPGEGPPIAIIAGGATIGERLRRRWP